MNRPRWLLKDAKNKVDTVVGGAIKGIPQIIVAQGAPVAVVLSAKEYRRLKGERLKTGVAPGQSRSREVL